MCSYYDPPEPEEHPCEICDRHPDACQCPECPVCGEVGRLACMEEHGLIVPGITKADIEARNAAYQAESDEMEALSIEADRITQEGRDYAEQHAEEQALNFSVSAADFDDFAYDAERERRMRRR